MERKVSLLIKNYESLKNVKTEPYIKLTLHERALKYTLKDKYINFKEVNECTDIIRESTSIFSDFRGDISINTAIIISFQSQFKESLEEILKIHKKLRQNKFYSGDSLALISNMIFENKNKIDIDECIEKTKYVYEFMRNNHPFSTSIDDYINACIVAINSQNIDEELIDMEEAYVYLCKNGFYKNNTLKNLSQVISLTRKKEVWEKCIYVKKELEKNNCKFHKFGYPLIGVMAFLEIKDMKSTIEKIKNISDKLKIYRGYGSFALDENYRNIIAGFLVIQNYISNKDKNSILISITIDDINKAMNIAIMTATTSSIILNNI